MYRMVQKARATATSTAPPEVVYELLLDPTTWTAWSTMHEVRLEVPGRDEPYGVGSVRALDRGRVHGLDEVVELVPGKRFGYRHVRGLPVRDYRADVDLEPIAGGTRITWSATFRPRYVGTGWILRSGVRRLLAAMTTGLAEHAATRTAAGG